MELDSLRHPRELTFPALGLNFPSDQMVKIVLGLPACLEGIGTSRATSQGST